MLHDIWPLCDQRAGGSRFPVSSSALAETARELRIEVRVVLERSLIGFSRVADAHERRSGDSAPTELFALPLESQSSELPCALPCALPPT